jgi:DNA-binding transcriptional LysR family regulator
MFLDRAGDVLSRSDDLAREMNLLRGLDSGDLRIGAGIYPADMFVGEAVARLVNAHPGIRLRMIGGNWADLIALLRKREADLVIADASAVAGDPEIVVTPLHPRQGYFLVRATHPLVEKRRPTLADVTRFPLAASSRLTPALIEPLLRVASESRSPPSVACESLSMIKTIVAGSDAVGLLPLCVVNQELEERRLAVLPLVEPWLRGDFAAMRLARRGLSPSGEEFQRILVEVDHEVFDLERRMAPRFVSRRSGG